ncbi:MAG: helix-turn-helix transcriptional regulator [Candidatus Omnitrophica bacterium]|nr:helix-turn-helix transcriptional regulator [Candidatus Omnitrophota bacterium]
MLAENTGMSTPKIRLQFAAQLRRLRKDRDLTQEAMAERVGMDIRYYQRLESRNPNAVKIDTIDKIAKALRLPPWKLLKF